MLQGKVVVKPMPKADGQRLYKQFNRLELESLTGVLLKEKIKAVLGNYIDTSGVTQMASK